MCVCVSPKDFGSRVSGGRYMLFPCVGATADGRAVPRAKGSLLDAPGRAARLPEPPDHPISRLHKQID